MNQILTSASAIDVLPNLLQSEMVKSLLAQFKVGRYNSKALDKIPKLRQLYEARDNYVNNMNNNQHDNGRENSPYERLRIEIKKVYIQLMNTLGHNYKYIIIFIIACAGVLLIYDK